MSIRSRAVRWLHPAVPAHRRAGTTAHGRHEPPDRSDARPATFAVGLGLFAAFVVANEVSVDGSVVERTLVCVVAMLAAAGLVLAFRAAGRVVRGILAIGVGSLAVAGVLGMRAYAIPKTGLAPIDVLAVPALLAATVLLVDGSALLLRPVRG
jgi:hypothetical protein